MEQSGSQIAVALAKGTALSIVGDEASMHILQALARAPLRFSALGQGMSSKTLSLRLKALEQAGLLTRTAYAQVPMRVEYALTPKGQELLSIADGIATWEASWNEWRG